MKINGNAYFCKGAWDFETDQASVLYYKNGVLELETPVEVNSRGALKELVQSENRALEQLNIKKP